MTSQQRIENIEKWLHQQRYLYGLAFRILEEKDSFIIEFAVASQRQMATLNRALLNEGMTHIRGRAIKILQFEPKHRRR